MPHSATDQHRTRVIVSALLFVLAAGSFVSLMLAFAAPESRHLLVILLRAPSRFFVKSFHLASFYVPAVFCAAGIMLHSRKANPFHLFMLGLSVIPFLTLALAFRIGSRSAIGSSPITSGLVDAVGLQFSTVGTILLAVLEIAAMVYFWYSRRNGAASMASAAVAGAQSAGERSPVALLDAPAAEALGRVVASRPETLVDLPEPEAHLQPEARWEPEPEREPEPEVPVGAYADVEDLEIVEAEEDELEEDELGDPGPSESEPDESDSEETDDGPMVLSFADGRFSRVEPEPKDEVGGDESGKKKGRKPRKPRSLAYKVPIDGLLDEYQDGEYWRIDDTTREAAETLTYTLQEFGIQAEVTGIRKGPVITMFEVLPAPGVKLSKIVNLAENIAMRLAAKSVRIVAPIPGKHAVGIEIPNAHRAIVGFAELLKVESFKSSRLEIPIALGKDIPGDAQIVDLTRMPHVLIAGATGSGKSVCVNSIIGSILYRRSPQEVKLILIDPKIVELKFYNDIPHLLTPVVTDPKRAFQALQYCIYEMERRYTLLDALQVRDVKSYNRKITEQNLATESLPYIVVVVDEFADLMATSGKELEAILARLAAMSRAVGIHLVLATQRPSTDVITGLIKSNIPSRIAFMVASKIDSRIIIDSQGAEKLLGRGDMLFTSAWDPFPQRVQGAFVSDGEVERIVEHVKQLGEPEYIDDVIFVDEEDEDYVQGELEDPLMEKAIDIVVTANKASASYLQRRLKVGYNRAARMVEEMERLGIVGPQQGSKPRDIIGHPAGT